MKVISQDEKAIINLDRTDYVEILNEMIVGQFNNRRVKLGEYKSEERCKEILEELIKFSYPSSFDGEYEELDLKIKTFIAGTKIFYMPKE